MKKTLFNLITITCLGYATSCSEVESSSGKEGTTVNLSAFNVADRENLGNSGDIYLNYSISGDISELNEVRLMVSKSTLTREEAENVASENYFVPELSSSFQSIINENLLDVAGDLITEDELYNIYILMVFDGEIVSELSEPVSLTLSNEIVVTTPTLSGSFNAMEDIVISSDGTLYVNGGGISETALYKVTSDGESSLLNNSMEGAVGIALDANENIYSSNFNARTIKKTTLSGTATDFVSVTNDFDTDDRLVGGGGLAFDEEGYLYNTFWASSTLYRITPAGVIENFVTSSSLNGPVGVYYDRDDQELYVSNFTDGKILNVSTDDGTITTVVDTDISIGHLCVADGYFYATGWDEHVVNRVSPDGNKVEVIGSGLDGTTDGTVSEASFSQPNGIDATPDGKYIYVTQGDGKLRKIVLKRES